MNTLGAVLDVMVTCGERWPSVHAELVHRRDPVVAAEARRAALRDQVARAASAATGDGGGAPAGTGGAGGTEPAGTVGRLPTGAFVPAPAQPGGETGRQLRRGRLLAAEGLLRVEWPDEDEVTVLAGSRWRRRRGEQVSGAGNVGEGGLVGRPGVAAREQVLVSPWLLLSWLRPRLGGPAIVGGRSVTRLAAIPRPGPRPPRAVGLADGAERLDLLVDDETGVVVDLAAFFEGRLVERLALRHLTVGDVPDPRLFDLAALDVIARRTGVTAAAPGAVPPGALPPGAVFAAGRPLAELAAEVDFPLCLPLGRALVGRVERRSEGAVVVAHSMGDETLTVSQSAGAGIADTAGWERIHLPDGTEASWWPPDGDLLQGHLVFDRAGTRVWIRGVDRAAMTALALILRPPR
jgi:hypothetical protein